MKFKLAIAFLILFAACALAFQNYFGDLPAPDAMISRSSPDATKIFDRNGRLLFEILDPRSGRRTRVALNDLPVHFRNAVVAVEDSDFYSNPGVDITGIMRAAWQNFRAGTIVSGASTITQQLARELLLSKEERETRSYLRKLREAVLALRISQSYPKDQILEMYVNEVYYGNLAYGIEAASRTYFGKPARDLDLAESALLAGVIQSPAMYDPFVNLDAALKRQRIVLGLMVKNGLVSDQEAQTAREETLHFVPVSSTTMIHAPHFVAYVRDILEARLGPEQVNHGGLRVVTTLDLDLQERGEAIIRQQLAELRRRTIEDGAPDYNVSDAALVALDPATGEILAMVGSADYFDEEIDGAVNVALANRQPGSAIKPITYATAFARDYSPATVLSDVPTVFQTKENQPYEPQNYDRAWHGPMSLRQALATSNNMIAVKVLDHVGVDGMIETAKKLGITTFDDPERFGLALTLGGGEVKLLELTAAYAAFANRGKRVSPVAILSVNEKRNEEIAAQEESDEVISPQVAYQITSVLSDDGARIGAFGEESALALSRPAAAKTGTTTDYKDNWTIGYTPNLATGVWVGNADNEPMYKISGITGAGPIWHDFMDEALKTRPVVEFVRPTGLVDVEVCDTTGLLPTENCPRRRTEAFIAGREPQEVDQSYVSIAIDSASGLLWSDQCSGARVDKIFRILPDEARDWGKKQGLVEPPSLDCGGKPGYIVAAKSAALEATKLIISSPADNALYTISRQLPPEYQKIEITARASFHTDRDGITLQIDGRPIASLAQSPYRVFWQLEPGEHTIQAISRDSAGVLAVSKQVHFYVESAD